MSLGMYKPGQGYWTRVLTAMGSLALAAGGANWIATHFASHFVSDPATQEGTAKKIVWAVVVGGTVIAMWIVLNKPRVVDFMIATETEMKKVSWPTRKTLTTMTLIVIGGVLGLAGLVWVIDILFSLLFQAIHIL